MSAQKWSANKNYRKKKGRLRSKNERKKKNQKKEK